MRLPNLILLAVLACCAALWLKGQRGEDPTWPADTERPGAAAIDSVAARALLLAFYDENGSQICAGRIFAYTLGTYPAGRQWPAVLGRFCYWGIGHMSPGLYDFYWFRHGRDAVCLVESFFMGQLLQNGQE